MGVFSQSLEKVSKHVTLVVESTVNSKRSGVYVTTQLSWKVGGQQGEGVDSTGEIFAIALNRLGYYLYGYRHFSSRIKGGHTNNKQADTDNP